MKKPIISIIIPAYNEENYIFPCLKSIVEQDFPKKSYEIIVINNNSSDKTKEIIKNNFPKVRIVDEPKQGLVFARIRGVSEAKSKIIAFTDADTEVSPKWLKTIYTTYQKYPDIAGIGIPANLQPKNLLVFLFQPIANLGVIIFKVLPGYNFSFKKDVYLKCGGYSLSANFSEDLYISKKIKQFGRAFILKENLVIASSRRYQNPGGFFNYAFKYLVSSLTISLFDFSFFSLKPVIFKKQKSLLKLFARSGSKHRFPISNL